MCKGEESMSVQYTRGIDHIGLTVADVESAEKFLIDGLGAEFVYETLGFQDEPFHGPDLEKFVDIPQGSSVNLIRMYKLGNGPGIELIHYTTTDQRPALRTCDIGWQHIALYVDDLEAAVTRFVKAGGQQLGPIRDLPGAESGAGNKLCYLRAPFGAWVELLTYPTEPPYTRTTRLRRWTPSLIS
jgi:catechol 2,3-dioxygenase-like lactoylglutathione lyase family enzyme